MNNEIIGKGWSFPPRFNRLSGEVDMAEGNDEIRQGLAVILSTELGERFLQPNFGCTFSEYQFMNFTHSIRASLSRMVARTLSLQEPRIEITNVDVKDGRNDIGEFFLDIQYFVIETGRKESMVYPFYTNSGL